MGDEESQADELLALENIYTQEEFKSLKENGHLGGHFFAFIVFENELKLLFKDLRDPGSCLEEVKLKYLPPLSLLFSFPKDYPSLCPPDFTLSCQWLRTKDITKLCRKLDAIWEENKGMEIMFIWTQFLKEEALKFLGIDKELDISGMFTYYLRCVEKISKRRHLLSSGGGPPPGDQRAVQDKGGGESASSKEDQGGDEQPRHLTHTSSAAEEEHMAGKEARPFEMKPLEEGAMQDCCCNTKPLEPPEENPVGSPSSPRENTGGTKTRSNRRHRPNAEVKEGKNKQSVHSQDGVELPKECDTNRLGEAMCSISRTRRRYDRDGHGSKLSEKYSTNNVMERKLNNRNSSGVEHASVNELDKTDVKPDQPFANTNTHSAQSRGSSRHRKSEKRPRNGAVEKGKERKQLHFKNRSRKMEVDRRAIVDLHPRTPIIQHLLDYNIRKNEIQFERYLHTCKICFEDKLGVYCMKFEPCEHVFCSDCITSYFEVRIKEGTVLSMPCPEDKCTSEAMVSQVQALIDPEMFTKYDSILLSALLDTQPDVIYCPRRQCQYPVFHEDKSDKLATCPECSYAFCVLCEKVYHGVAPCVIVPEEKRKLMEKYVRASGKEKEQMESRYGKQQLKNLVDTFHLEWSESWIKKNSKKCPHCNTAIEKACGCNKMQCWKCDTVFCWLCNMRLDRLKPYNHFNDKSSPCFNSLFRGLVGEDDMDEEFDFDEEFINEEFVGEDEELIL